MNTLLRIFLLLCLGSAARAHDAPAPGKGLNCQGLLALDLKTPYQNPEDMMSSFTILREKAETFVEMKPEQRTLWAIAAFNASFAAQQSVSVEFLFMFLAVEIQSLGPIAQDCRSNEKHCLSLKSRMQLLKIHLESGRPFTKKAARDTYYDFLVIQKDLDSKVNPPLESLTLLRLRLVMKIPLELLIRPGSHPVLGFLPPFYNSARRLILLEFLTEKLGRIPTKEELQSIQEKASLLGEQYGDAPWTHQDDDDVTLHSAAFWAVLNRLQTDMPLQDQIEATKRHQAAKVRLNKIMRTVLGQNSTVNLSPLDYNFGLFRRSPNLLIGQPLQGSVTNNGV